MAVIVKPVVVQLIGCILLAFLWRFPFVTETTTVS